MKKIVFATGNAGKMKEIREILADLPVEIYSMKEAGISVEIDENGKTFEENAKIKAQTVAGCTDGDMIVLADDSGLEVDALNGEPGVYSARYMGEDTSYRIKNQSLVDRLEGVPVEKRTARFVCVIAAAFPDGTVCTTKGTIEGKIGYEERGENGFGYDLAGDGDIKAVLTRGAVDLAAQAVHDEAELAVVHVHAALPGDAAGVDVQGVALLDAVVDHGGQQVVGGSRAIQLPEHDTSARKVCVCETRNT